MFAKRIYLFLLGLLFIVPCLAQTAEEESIKKMLEEETADFDKMSVADLVKKHWVLDDKTLMYVTFPDGNHLRMDKEGMLASSAVPPAGHSKATKKDFKFNVFGDKAVVTFTQEVSTVEGDRVMSSELRYLEKVGGVWKIHISSVHQYLPKD
jgi:hypothetical protein